ncbi:MAG: hypothetical protein KC502_03410 [Myxococcales bacterium]|nr:hypothetical protein [Myxococcales bacterium]
MNQALLLQSAPRRNSMALLPAVALWLCTTLAPQLAIADTAKLILPAGQEALATQLFQAPGVTPPKTIRINKAEIVATWADGRQLFVRHPTSAKGPAVTRSSTLVVIRGKVEWKETELALIAKHISAAKPPMWRSAARSDGKERRRKSGAPSKRALRTDDQLHQVRDAVGIGELDKAKRLLAGIAKDKELGPGRRARLGALMRRAGDDEGGKKVLAKAIADLEITAQKQPERRPDWAIALARLDPKAAQAAASDGLKKDKAPCRWAEVAEVLRQQKAVSLAQATASAVLAKDPKCEPAWITRALAGNEALSRWPETLKVANEALKQLPESLPLLNVKAGALHAGFRNREAAELWEQVARRDLQFPGVMGMLATAWTQLPEVLDDDFLDPFHERLGRDPKDVVTRYIVGTASYYRDDFRAVIRYLDPLRSVLPREPRVHLYTAMAHFHLGHKKAAEARLETLQTFGHNDPDYYYCRSVMRRNTDFEGSLRDLETFVRLSKGRQNSAAKVFKMHRELEVMRSGRLPNAFDLLPDWLRFSLMGLAGLLLATIAFLTVRWRRRQD